MRKNINSSRYLVGYLYAFLKKYFILFSVLKKIADTIYIDDISAILAVLGVM